MVESKKTAKVSGFEKFVKENKLTTIKLICFLNPFELAKFCGSTKQVTRTS
jgi:hypothetical protein